VPERFERRERAQGGRDTVPYTWDKGQLARIARTRRSRGGSHQHPAGDSGKAIAGIGCLPPYPRFREAVGKAIEYAPSSAASR